MDNLKHPI